MSGFVGYLSDKVDEKVLKKMNNRIKNRGLDLENYYIDENIGFGFRGSIVEKGDEILEPISDKNNVVIMDGRIYNYKELKKELTKLGYKFKTDSETEILLYGYNEWKYDVVKKIDGMFSFAIWNKNNKELFLGRDKWGLKPLYYYHKEDNFIFGSELKCLLENPEFEKELNESILASYLCFNTTPTEETFFKNVYRVEPGHFLVLKNNKRKTKRYYKLDFKENLNDYNKAVEELKSSMKKSIDKHIIDREVGSFLSSGVDSSYLVSLSKPNNTFTIGYNISKYNETDHAKKLCDSLGINNNSTIIKKENYLTNFPKIIYRMDEPVADPSMPSLYFGAEAASKMVKVVMSGEGADEFFGGYNYYKTEIDESWYFKVPYFIRNIFYRVASIFPDVWGFNFLYRNGQKLENFNIGLGRVFRDKEALSIVKNKDQIKTKDILKSYYDEYKDKSNIVKKQVIDYYFWLVKDFLHILDRNTASFNMEARTPFLDDDVFNVASRLTTNLKINKTTTKVVLRSAAESVIPTDVYKNKKLGFPVPLREWVREDLFYNEIKEKFNGDIASKYFNQKKILKLLEQHRNNKKDNYKKIWAIYTFIIWYQEYFK